MVGDAVRPRRVDLRTIVEILGPLVALAGLVTFTACYSDAFLKPENLLNILRQAAPWGIVAIGMTFVIISGGIDLSVGSQVALTAGTGLLVMNYLADRETAPTSTIAVTVCAMVLGGAILGAINGLLVSVGKLAPFIATLATLAMYRSLILAQAQGGAINGRVSSFTDLASKGIALAHAENGRVSLYFSYPVMAFVVVALAGWWLLRFTTFGTRVKAVGGNERAAEYAAVHVGRVRFFVYLLAGLTCGIAAVLAGARQNSVSTPMMGVFYELDAIAAVVIGGASLAGGRGRIFGTVVGVLILAVMGNMLQMLSVGTHYQGLVKGGIILAAVLVQRIGRRAG